MNQVVETHCLSAGMPHQAKQASSFVSRKGPNYTEDGLNIQQLLSVCLYEKLSVYLCQKRVAKFGFQKQLCTRPSFIKLTEGWSKISTLVVCKN